MFQDLSGSAVNGQDFLEFSRIFLELYSTKSRNLAPGCTGAIAARQPTNGHSQRNLSHFNCQLYLEHFNGHLAVLHGAP
jgi:hypothetical protein